MIRFLAVVFGIGFIFAGVAGFRPEFISNGLLLGIFEVNDMHNIVHIVSGVLAIMAATSLKYTKLYFLIFGLVYTAVAILGFVRNGDLMMMHTNMADNYLHLGIGIICILLGLYAYKRS